MNSINSLPSLQIRFPKKKISCSRNTIVRHVTAIRDLPHQNHSQVTRMIYMGKYSCTVCALFVSHTYIHTYILIHIDLNRTYLNLFNSFRLRELNNVSIYHRQINIRVHFDSKVHQNREQSIIILHSIICTSWLHIISAQHAKTIV